MTYLYNINYWYILCARVDLMKAWKKPILITFLYATVLLGLTDFFHTATGVQRYLFDSDILLIKAFHWPWYLPFQMGCIAVTAMLLWVLAYNFAFHAILPKNELRNIQPFGRWLPFFVTLMVVTGFFLGYITLQYDHHISIYVIVYIASLIFIEIAFSRDYMLAFLMMGISGPLAEWLLLSPSIGYYEFVQKDLFGRVPAWQLFAYGWGGVFFHRVSAPIRKK